MKDYDVVVVGAGFAGIYTSWRLAKDGLNVALVEASDVIGGNLNSQQWNGYWFDNGTHNFDIRTQIGEDFFTDILGENILYFEDQKWACTTDKSWTFGFEMPDFGEDDPIFAEDVIKELHDILALADQRKEPKSFYEFYKQKYGNRLAERIMPMIAKYTGSNPLDFDIEARGLMGMFSRPKLGSDNEMLVFKKTNKFWDDRLGVTIDCGDERFLGKNSNKRFCYPKERGLRGFCIAAKEKLQQLGVDVYLSSIVTKLDQKSNGVKVYAGEHVLKGRKVFWSLPETILSKLLGLKIDLIKQFTPVGTAFFGFEVPADNIIGPDYLHDYSLNRLPFRYNKQGVYSNQIKENGNTLIMAEVPCHPKNISQIANDENIRRVWNDLLDVGFLRQETKYAAATAIGHPVAYTIPNVGWRKSFDEIKNYSRTICPDLIGIEFGYRGRLNFMNFFENSLKNKFQF